MLFCSLQRFLSVSAFAPKFSANLERHLSGLYTFGTFQGRSRDPCIFRVGVEDKRCAQTQMETAVNDF